MATFNQKRFLNVAVPLAYALRPVTLCILAVVTVFFAWMASRTFVDAGFDKSIPLEHEYMQTLRKYQANFGGGNTVLVAIIQKEGKGEIYNERFLTTLKKATDAVFFLPGVDRSRVTSLFTPNTRYIEVVEGGFAGGSVIPARYAPTPEMIALVKTNTGKAGVVGHLVTNDERGAMITTELVEVDPTTGQKLQYSAVAHDLEDKIRGQFTKSERYEWHLKEDWGSLKAGTLVYTSYSEPSRFLRFQSITADQKTEAGQPIAIPGSKVDVVKTSNPDYNPDIDVHIIGFAKVVGDVSDAAAQVAVFFAITLLMTGILLWAYIASLLLALVVLTVSVVAVIWEFGLLACFGYGLDPFAILVPFLILAVSVSHGVQYVNCWARELANGRNSLDASAETFRWLLIPGFSAILTDAAGFATIYMIPIQIIREMAINACFGMLAITATNKMLCPIILSYITIKDVGAFEEAQWKRDAILTPLFKRMTRITYGTPAVVTLGVAVLVLGWSLYKSQDLIIGDVQRGVPELREDSRYNRDSNAIGDNFAIGTDVLKVIAESKPEACITYDIMEEVDRFAWRMQNTAGVQSVASLPELAKRVNMGFNEGAPKFQVLPRNRFSLSQATTPIPTSSGLLNSDCSAMAVVLFTTDHRAETLSHIVREVKKFEAAKENDAVTFSLASGNVGVMAATNEVVADKEGEIVYWVYAVVILLVWLSFRSVGAVVCIILPLALVSMLGYGVMAVLDIGMKVATLPVVSLAVGIGVDYGIYIYAALWEGYAEHRLSFPEACLRAYKSTGRAVLFTGITLAMCVATWLWSDLKFQADMGLLLVFLFSGSMLGGMLLTPTLASFFMRRR